MNKSVQNEGESKWEKVWQRGLMKSAEGLIYIHVGRVHR